VTRQQIVDQLIAGLNAHHVPGVFAFINGARVSSPDFAGVMQDWVAGDFFVGNQGFNHLDLRSSSVDAYVADITSNEPIIAGFGDAQKIFFYSYFDEGETFDKRDAIRATLAQRGYLFAHPTVWFEDWAWNAAFARCVAKGDQASVTRLEDLLVQAETDYLAYSQQLSQTVFQRDIPHTLVLHMANIEADAIDRLLTALEQKGVVFVPVTQALADSAYATDPHVLYDPENQQFPDYDMSFLEQMMESQNRPFTRPNIDDFVVTACQ
jgi:peptidoglycan/xylan/chitin deacetylase (PgdA/CDA1 family)